MNGPNHRRVRCPPIRLGDALGRACGQWFGDQVLADGAVGLVLLAVPVVGVLWLRLRSRG